MDHTDPWVWVLLQVLPHLLHVGPLENSQLGVLFEGVLGGDDLTADCLALLHHHQQERDFQSAHSRVVEAYFSLGLGEPVEEIADGVLTNGAGSADAVVVARGPQEEDVVRGPPPRHNSPEGR